VLGLNYRALLRIPLPSVVDTAPRYSDDTAAQVVEALRTSRLDEIDGKSLERTGKPALHDVDVADAVTVCSTLNLDIDGGLF